MARGPSLLSEVAHGFDRIDVDVIQSARQASRRWSRPSAPAREETFAVLYAGTERLRDVRNAALRRQSLRDALLGRIATTHVAEATPGVHRHHAPDARVPRPMLRS